MFSLLRDIAAMEVVVRAHRPAQDSSRSPSSKDGKTPPSTRREEGGRGGEQPAYLPSAGTSGSVITAAAKEEDRTAPSTVIREEKERGEKGGMPSSASRVLGDAPPLLLPRHIPLTKEDKIALCAAEHVLTSAFRKEQQEEDDEEKEGQKKKGVKDQAMRMEEEEEEQEKAMLTVLRWIHLLYQENNAQRGGDPLPPSLLPSQALSSQFPSFPSSSAEDQEEVLLLPHSRLLDQGMLWTHLLSLLTPTRTTSDDSRVKSSSLPPSAPLHTQPQQMATSASSSTSPYEHLQNNLSRSRDSPYCASTPPPSQKKENEVAPLHLVISSSSSPLTPPPLSTLHQHNTNTSPANGEESSNHNNNNNNNHHHHHNTITPAGFLMDRTPPRLPSGPAAAKNSFRIRFQGYRAPSPPPSTSTAASSRIPLPCPLPPPVPPSSTPPSPPHQHPHPGGNTSSASENPVSALAHSSSTTSLSSPPSSPEGATAVVVEGKKWGEGDGGSSSGNVERDGERGIEGGTRRRGDGEGRLPPPPPPSAPSSFFFSSSSCASASPSGFPSHSATSKPSVSGYGFLTAGEQLQEDIEAGRTVHPSLYRGRPGDRREDGEGGGGRPARRGGGGHPAYSTNPYSNGDAAAAMATAAVLGNRPSGLPPPRSPALGLRRSGFQAPFQYGNHNNNPSLAGSPPSCTPTITTMVGMGTSADGVGAPCQHHHPPQHHANNNNPPPPPHHHAGKNNNTPHSGGNDGKGEPSDSPLYEARDYPSCVLLPDGSVPTSLQSIDPKLVHQVTREIVEHHRHASPHPEEEKSGVGGGETHQQQPPPPPRGAVTWEDIAGLQDAKRSVEEAIVWPLRRPDLFVGLRDPPRGLLLFGPPGTGKTLIARAIATRSSCTFFSISASSLMSKWYGEAEQLVRCLFAVATLKQPSVIFVDEIDSLLSMRGDSEGDSVRRLKTEFLVQMDGVGTKSTDRVLLIGATNRPEELDEAARRRLEKRLYIPLPDPDARLELIQRLLASLQKKEDETAAPGGGGGGGEGGNTTTATPPSTSTSSVHALSKEDLSKLVQATDGYSGADIRLLCREAAMAPLREATMRLPDWEGLSVTDLRPLERKDFKEALRRIRPSVGPNELTRYESWNRLFGSFCHGTEEIPPEKNQSSNNKKKCKKEKKSKSNRKGESNEEVNKEVKEMKKKKHHHPSSFTSWKSKREERKDCTLGTALATPQCKDVKKGSYVKEANENEKKRKRGRSCEMDESTPSEHEEDRWDRSRTSSHSTGSDVEGEEDSSSSNGESWDI